MAYLVDKMFSNNKSDGIREWITVKGVHVPIKEGQTKEEAVKDFVDSKQKDRSPKEKEVKKEEKKTSWGGYDEAEWQKLKKLAKKVGTLKNKLKSEMRKGAEGWKLRKIEGKIDEAMDDYHDAVGGFSKIDMQDQWDLDALLKGYKF